jgi:protein TonB
MFEDSLLEQGGRGKTKKGWTVAVSFVVQSVILTVMILIPLIYTEALPATQMLTKPQPIRRCR